MSPMPSLKEFDIVGYTDKRGLRMNLSGLADDFVTGNAWQSRPVLRDAIAESLRSLSGTLQGNANDIISLDFQSLAHHPVIEQQTQHLDGPDTHEAVLQIGVQIADALADVVIDDLLGHSAEEESRHLMDVAGDMYEDGNEERGNELYAQMDEVDISIEAMIRHARKALHFPL